MHVAPSRLLPILGLAVVALSTSAGVTHAAPPEVPIPAGHYDAPLEIPAGTVRSVLVNQHVSFGKAGFRLTGGILRVHGTLELKETGDSFFHAGEIQGSGTIKIAPTAGLRIVTVPGGGNSRKKISSVDIVNQGTIEWGGPGRIECEDDVSLDNYGTIVARNGYFPSRDKLQRFLNHKGGRILQFAGISGTMPGNLSNLGEIHVGANWTDLGDEAKKHVPNDNLGMPSPSSLYISGSGTVGQPGSVLCTTIGTAYYGQLAVLGTMNINAGTLKYVLSPSTLLPPNSDVYQILKATTITTNGAYPYGFQYFDPANFRFDRRFVTTGSPDTYELYSFN